MKITTRDRRNLNAAMIVRGLDGNGRFKSCGAALHAMGEALATEGLSLGLVTGQQAPRDDAETLTKRYTVEKHLDAAGEQIDEIENSILVVSFYYHLDGDRFEAVAYMS